MSPSEAAEANGIELQVLKLSEAKRGFVLLRRRWVMERSFVWTTWCRRLVRDYEQRSETLMDLHFLAFACLNASDDPSARRRSITASRHVA